MAIKFDEYILLAIARSPIVDFIYDFYNKHLILNAPKYFQMNLFYSLYCSIGRTLNVADLYFRTWRAKANDKISVTLHFNGQNLACT